MSFRSFFPFALHTHFGVRAGLIQNFLLFYQIKTIDGLNAQYIDVVTNNE